MTSMSEQPPVPEHSADEEESGLQDAVRLNVGDKEVILVGTAHISQESVDAVRSIISQESPDVVCVELDAQRYKALRDKNWWQSLNLFEVFRKGQAPFLMANLVLSSYQRRLGRETGVKPGAELAEAARVAEDAGIEVVLCDREIRKTLLRAWRKTGFWKKSLLAAEIVSSVLPGGGGGGGDDEGMKAPARMTEEELRRLRQGDTLSLMLEEMGKTLPTVKKVLVDERDMFMSAGIRDARGQKVVAVVGAAHVPGITRHLTELGPSSSETLAEIDTIPERSLLSRIVPWLVPLIVLGLFVAGFFYGDTKNFQDAAVAWVLANGILSALGALIALGHPLTIVAAFIAAPITSLNPTIGAGYVTGIVQTWFAPPSVRDMENLSDDLISWKGWWTNRMGRVLIVFFFSSLGSTLGTLVAFKWLADLI